MSILKLSYYAILENNKLSKNPFKYETIHSDQFPIQEIRMAQNEKIENYTLTTVDEQIGRILQDRLYHLDAEPLRETPLEWPELLIDNNPSKHKYGLRDGYFLVSGDLIK